MAESFMIDQVSWHTSVPGNTETRPQIIHRFFRLANFLQDRGLTARNIGRRQSEIDDDFSIHSDDLTDEGFAVMKIAYDKWLTKLDHGMSPDDVSLLEQALKRVRAS